MSVEVETTPVPLQVAMSAVQDSSISVNDRAAMYGWLYAVKRQIDRALGTYTRGKATAKSELTEHIVREDLEELGPLYVTWEPFDVAYPVNDEGNWGDAGVQEQLETFAKIASEYIRHVPEHYEVNTSALGEGLSLNDPVAKELHRACKDRGWRIEGGRRAALRVREVRKAA
jgi:hypothetical protein